MKLPRVMRAARSRVYGYQNPQRELDSFNRGFRGDHNANLPDALRGSSVGMNHTQAEIDSMYKAALNCPRRRG